MKKKGYGAVVFDLDGTIAESKQPISGRMASLLTRLLSLCPVAVVGGGKFSQIKSQTVSLLPKGANFGNLYIFPVNGAEAFRFRGGWKRWYFRRIPAASLSLIRKEAKKAMTDGWYIKPKKTYGALIQNRGAQVTISFLGQHAPLKPKTEWHRKNNGVRLKVAEALRKRLKKFEVQVAGLTSIDITAKGMDKEFAIRRLSAKLKIPVGRIIFLGDAIYPGGNDYPATKSGAATKLVKNPGEAEGFIAANLL